MSFGVVSCELTRSRRLELMGSSIWGIEGCHHSICDCRWCLYTGIYSSTQCDKHYQLIMDIVNISKIALSMHWFGLITYLHEVWKLQVFIFHLVENLYTFMQI